MLIIVFGAIKVNDWAVVKKERAVSAETWEFVRPTGSMQPCIGNNDLFVVAKNVSDKKISVGDIVVYSKGIDEAEYRIMHRVVFVINTSNLPNSTTLYIVKGDANPYPDQWFVKQEEISGIVEKIEFR